MNNPFYVFLTFDIDQDFNPDSPDYYNRNQASFDSFRKDFNKILDEINNPFSVFLRADYQIYKLYGSYDYLIKNNPELIHLISSFNGEINWHIHLYEESNKNWIQIKNTEQLVQRFIEDFKSVQNVNNIRSDIVRVGECVMNNELMRAMNDLGIRIDSTALPGRRRNDEQKFFDWEKTKNNIYHPSQKDYRIEGNPFLSIKEVPMSTLEMKAQYDKKAILRYFNLSFKSKVLFENFDSYIMQNERLVTITHPFEIIGHGNHGLISYDLNVFKKNLLLLDETIKKNGKQPVYLKMSDLINE
jgi:hypothetical protein